ncbi:hypothetical protein [Bacillus sp. FSL K6-3431]|uniref:hypothetical protein n=1 Tax=Bacillus sp. FSL K6-3431 TaxID=2921500 RepID=UPI0030F6C843
MGIEINNETFVNEKEILSMDFIADYLKLIAEPSVKPSTFKRYQSSVKNRLIAKFGHMKSKNISGKNISHYYHELLKEGLTEEFIQYLHSILKLAYKTAVDWKYIKNDFMDNVKSPNLMKKDIETWSIDECNTFLNRMRKQKIIYLCYTI